MPTVDANTNEDPEGPNEEGRGEETPVWLTESKRPHCDAYTVRQTIDAVEQSALDSHRGQGVTDDELRITMRAAENARRTLADGKTDPCMIVPQMFRQVQQGELEEDED